jgi:hypothetical protein
MLAVRFTPFDRERILGAHPKLSRGYRRTPLGRLPAGFQQSMATFPLVLLLHRAILLKRYVLRVSPSARHRKMTLEVCAKMGDSHGSAGTV